MTVETVAVVLLCAFSFLFVSCFAISQVRQRLHANRKHRNWSARYHGRAQQRLENKRRVWAMFGLTYKGTIDDVRQSDDEDDGDIGEPKFSDYRPAAVHVPGAQPLPPPYSAGTEGVWGLRSAPLSPPQRPERFHDSKRNEDMDHEIASPKPQRHFQLKAPELVASGPLRRSDTIRSVRQCPTLPVSRVAPEPNPFGVDANQPNIEPPISSVRLEPPVSPRRLDSISRRRNDEG